MPDEPDAATVAGLLLLAGPLLGLVPVAYPPFLSIWSASRERPVSTVAAHRRAWWLLNAGFTLATIATAAGLAVLAGALGDAEPWFALRIVAATAYAMGGVLWCAVLAIRARTTPAIFDLGAIEAEPGPAERLLGAATGGLFAVFIVVTGAALVTAGVALANGGGVAIPVAWLVGASGALVIAVQLATGDTVPAVLYLPTLLVGVALLAGWT